MSGCLNSTADNEQMYETLIDVDNYIGFKYPDGSDFSMCPIIA